MELHEGFEDSGFLRLGLASGAGGFRGYKGVMEFTGHRASGERLQAL